MSVTAKAVLFAEADPATAAGDSPGWRGTLQRLGTPLAAASAAAKATVEVSSRPPSLACLSRISAT